MADPSTAEGQIASERKAATMKLLSSSQRSAAGHPDPLLAQASDAAGDRNATDPAAQNPAPPDPPSPGPGQAQGPGGGQGPRGFGQRPGGAGGPGGQTGGSTEGVSLQFPLNPVSDLLTIYEELIGKTIVKDTSIFDGPQVSLVTPGRVPRDEAVRLIEMTLVTNGYVIVSEPGEDSVKILLGRPRQQSQSSSFSEGIVIYTEPEALPVGESLVGFFLKLNNISPDEAAAILGNHVVLNEYGRITPVANPPGLLVTESSAIVRQLIQLRAIIDVAPQDASLLTQFVQLQYADANTVAQIIQAAVDARAEEAQRLGEAGRTITGQRPSGDNNQRSSNNSSNQRTPTPSSSRTSQGNSRAPDLSGSGIGTADQPAAQLIADDRLNRIMVVASPSDTAYILDLIRQFDQPLDSPEPIERPLRYAKANDILPVIVDVLQDTGTGTTNLPGGRQIDTRPTPVVSSQLSALTGATAGQNNQAATRTNQTGVDTTGRPDQLAFPVDDVAPISVLVGKTRIIADRLANSIIVMGPGESQQIVIDIIDRLDRRPSQVYLATVIGQLQLGDDFEFGIDYLLKFTEFDGSDPNQGGIAAQSINNRSDVITNGNIADVRDSLITSAFGPIDGLNVYGQIGQNLDVFVNALEESGRFKVLSRPVVFTQNGKRAEITSGERVPVPETSLTDSSNVVNAAVSTTIGFEDVVLKLEVVPTINADGEVTLDIAQINDTVIGTQIVANNEVPIISTQELNTTVTVPDRNTLVLGGLITEQENTTERGIPWINKMPVLGPLTTSTVEQKEREELIIFIQPIVVFNGQDTLEASFDEDKRTEVGADAAAVFPQEAPELPVRMPEPKGKRRFFGLLPPARPEPEPETELIPVPDGRRYQQDEVDDSAPSYRVPDDGGGSPEDGGSGSGEAIEPVPVPVPVTEPAEEKRRSSWFPGFRSRR